MINQFGQYGVLGLIVAIFASVIVILDKRYTKMLAHVVREKETQIAELKSSSDQEKESIIQFLRNQNRLIENQNELIKGFIEVSQGFKALVNVMVENKPNHKKGL